MTTDADIHLESVTKRFGETTAVDDLTLSIQRGAFYALLGPSGCGKTTTLRMIGGFEDPTEGRVFLGGDDVTDLPPYKRDVNTVFQSYALFPHLTWSATSRSASSARRSARPRSAARVGEALELVQLGRLGKRKPGAALRRPAAARRARPRAGQPPAGAAARRAARRARPAPAQAAADRAQAHPAGGRHHVRARHARPGGGHDDGRHDRRDERRPDRAGRRRRRPLRAPAHRVRGELPRRLEPVDGTLRAARRRSRPSRRTTAPRCTCPRDRDRPARRPTRSAIGVRPGEDHARRPPATASPSRRERAARHASMVASFLGVSIQYVVRTAGGEELTVFAQNRDGAEPGSLGPGREVLLAWDPQHTFVVAKERSMSDPRSSAARAVPRGAALSRRRFLGRAGATALALTGAGDPARRVRRRRGHAEQGGEPAPDADASATRRRRSASSTFSNWPLYIDKKVLKDFDKQLRRQGQVHRGHQRQRRVLRQGPPAARSSGQPIGRDIVVLTDYMAARWVRAGYVEPIDKNNIPNAKNLSRRLAHDQLRPRAHSTRCRGSPARPAIGYNPRRPAASSRVVNDLFDPKFKGRVTMLSEPLRLGAASCCSATGIDASTATLDEILGRDREDRQGQRRGPVPPLHRQRLHDRPRQGQRLGLAGLLGRPRPAAGRQPGPRVHLPRGGRVAVHRQHDDARRSVAHPYAAETMMNYVYDPEVAAKIAAYVNYVTPVKGAKEVLARRTRDSPNNPLIFPPRRDAGQAARLPERSRRPRSAQMHGGDGSR